MKLFIENLLQKQEYVRAKLSQRKFCSLLRQEITKKDDAYADASSYQDREDAIWA